MTDLEIPEGFTIEGNAQKGYRWLEKTQQDIGKGLATKRAGKLRRSPDEALADLLGQLE